ncbi:MAG: cupin domain-containing protein [Proteobacteria bacterium]|nr:cupin domain-containing protein [Pseudomonadota bacterium]
MSRVFDTARLRAEYDALAPDGSEVRVLCRTAGGSMAQFTLPAGAVSRPVVHRRVEELWFFVSGSGQFWRARDGHQEIAEVGPGVSISITVGTRFQFRAGADAPLVAIAVTMPPWPEEGDAHPAPGIWEPTA